MKWIEHLSNGRILEYGQDDNGMCWAQIKDRFGLVESGTLCNTPNERNHWIHINL